MDRRPALVLASTSRYRRELLSRLGLPFEQTDPGVDETPHDGETPEALAQRLALDKARAVAARRPDALVIGSDQVMELDGRALGKPGTHAAAVAQLRAASGKVATFHTAVALVDGRSGACRQQVVPTTVRYRVLVDAEILDYLAREPALDCAGSAKSEGLGIALLASMRSDDPTALVGLPLITVADMLRAAGLPPLATGA